MNIQGVSQTRKATNVLNSIWWHKNITKNRKFYIYETIILSIFVFGAEVRQIHTREIKFYVQKWMCYGGQQENQGWKEKQMNI